MEKGSDSVEERRRNRHSCPNICGSGFPTLGALRSHLLSKNACRRAEHRVGTANEMERSKRAQKRPEPPSEIVKAKSTKRLEHHSFQLNCKTTFEAVCRWGGLPCSRLPSTRVGVRAAGRASPIAQLWTPISAPPSPAAAIEAPSAAPTAASSPPTASISSAIDAPGLPADASARPKPCDSSAKVHNSNPIQKWISAAKGVAGKKFREGGPISGGRNPQKSQISGKS